MCDTATTTGKKEEEDCRCFAHSRGCAACPPPRRITHPLRYYEFTQEEIQALEECDTESFYRRCLPLSTGLAGATLAAVRTGCLRRSRHWGVAPHLALAVVAGHCLGRAVSLPACAARLRELPADSHLGQTMRCHHDASAPKQ